MAKTNESAIMDLNNIDEAEADLQTALRSGGFLCKICRTHTSLR